ncbi:FAD-dependent oxidoreductase [Galbitalea soli]|uniref:NAD(P)/FAD-dependent oxidoreductase n=1 Tax=Galbitalea soli TaxID=1268042 RepID=A0A7C9PMB4_9MICO|nr:FAD-dependent oxidoreductase [Galbitalea soli]NEM90687.1 NAD(P)/FAD-dependent oxidoreductase [Galbitalea soli]NYJ31405.1 assimilatory nitrate reductase electron transfer subunit [Galbitalea soli]
MRIVLIGYGPVGARFVEEVLPLVREGRARLTVVGAEEHEPYNRVLLAEYAVGRADRERLELGDAEAAREAGVVIRLGQRVQGIDRTRQLVRLGDGTTVPYDRLVFATGARANIPTLAGLERPRIGRAAARADAALDGHSAGLPDGVVVLRDLADADTVRAAVRERRRVIVLGAGVLGMEFALAAREQGAEVVTVYHGDAPMERNLDAGGGRMLAAAARAAGVIMTSHSRAESVVLSTSDDGHRHFDALLCADGKQIDGDLLVLSCGVAPRVELADRAGLAVSTGILVDEELRSWSDPDVYAIGDCAHIATPVAATDQRGGGSTVAPGQHPRVTGAPSGLIGPGWRQAAWLAGVFAAELRAGERPALLPAERRPVVMLKAEGVSVCAAGELGADPWASEPGVEVTQWVDPARGRYATMTTRDGVLTGFVCAGLPRLAAELTLLFERGSELPPDRSALLALDGSAPGHGALRSASPDDVVCSCNGVTGRAISHAIACGSATVREVGSATRAGTGCGGCRDRIVALLDQAAESVADVLPAPVG